MSYVYTTGLKHLQWQKKDRTKPGVLFAQQLLEVSENQIDKWNQIVEKCIGKELKSQTNENK